MMKKITLLLALAVVLVGRSQVNIQLLSQIDYSNLHNTDINDIWGYVDETGIEYALVGAQKGTSIVSLQDPSNPTEVFWEPGMESVWRDLKTWGDYAFVTTEAENGLLIIDLSPLPSSNILPVSYYTGPVGSEWSSAHNLYIDENGYAYIFGANRGNGGVIILDVNTDPMNPIEVGVFDNWYCHDGFARNNILYNAHVEVGFLSLVDVTDKANPVLLGTKTTPSTFTHNIWPSDNAQFVYTTDEVSGGYLAAYDVSDPQNIVEVDRIQSSPGSGVIPHNAHVRGNYLVTSYYSDGVTIHDITHPNNMVEVGSYDTYPSQTTSYDGCWGAYPFLPSGILLATDITEGLFVLQPSYVQAAYLEGVITESGSGLPIAGVGVTINTNNQTDLSGNLGAYATGILNGGVYDVTYTKIGYYPQTFNLTLVNGQILNHDVQLVPIPPYNFSVTVRDAQTNALIPNAQIRLEADLLDHDGITNGIGVEDFVLYYQEEYRIVVGKWGYISNCYDQQIDDQTGAITVLLTKGYYDDFEFDFGWLSSGNADKGLWERGVPNATSSGSAPGIDADYDCGRRAYVTGNNPSLNPDLDDVDGGTAILISPQMDLTTYADPYLNFSAWMYCMHGAPPNDSLKVIVSNGTNTAKILTIGSDANGNFQWTPYSIRLLDYISLSNSMQVFFRLADLDPDVNITEGGVDYFVITNQAIAGVDPIQPDISVVYPNPFTDKVTVKGEVNEKVLLVDLNGRKVFESVLTSSEMEFDLQELKKGVYLIYVGSKTLKVIKD